MLMLFDLGFGTKKSLVGLIFKQDKKVVFSNFEFHCNLNRGIVLKSQATSLLKKNPKSGRIEKKKEGLVNLVR